MEFFIPLLLIAVIVIIFLAKSDIRNDLDAMYHRFVTIDEKLEELQEQNKQLLQALQKGYTPTAEKTKKPQPEKAEEATEKQTGRVVQAANMPDPYQSIRSQKIPVEVQEMVEKTPVKEEKEPVIEDKMQPIEKKEELAGEQQQPAKEAIPFDESPLERRQRLHREMLAAQKKAETATTATMEKPASPEPQPAEQTADEEKTGFNYEKYIGENLFGKIGILIFIIGMGFFVKYAIDNDWISPVMRTALGFAVGGVMLGIAQWAHKQYRLLSSLLAGGACAVFYVTVTIAYHYYQIFSSGGAFAILVAVSIFLIAISVLYDRKELAFTAIIGGFIAPFLTNFGDWNITLLMIYITLLNIVMFAITLYKKWTDLPIVSFFLTTIIMIGAGIDLFYLQDITYNAFSTIGYLLFTGALYIIMRRQDEPQKRLVSIFLLNNFVYLGLNAVFAYHFIGGYLFCLFIAVVNGVLWFYTENQQKSLLGSVLLAMVITFVTIAVPMYFGHNIITVCWATEAVLLLWLYTKYESVIYAWGSGVLAFLAIIAYGTVRVYHFWDLNTTPFLNSFFVTALFITAAFFVFALIMHRNKEKMEKIYDPLFPIILLASVVSFYDIVVEEFHHYYATVYGNVYIYLFTTVLLLGASYGMQWLFTLRKYPIHYLAVEGTSVAAGLFYFFCIRPDELPSIICVLEWVAIAVTLLHAIYISRKSIAETKTDNLPVYTAILGTLLWITAIHAFLLLFGVVEMNVALSVGLTIAALVVGFIGFRFHTKDLRIMSLVLFGFVLIKLALNDVWTLPSLGRIIVFILLGLALLILSFLYQKLKNVFLDDSEPSEQ